MKNLFLLLSLAVVVSCGSKNNVNSNAAVSGTSALEASAMVNFEGNYDIVRMDTNDCGAAVRIVQECSGYRLLSNNNFGAEDFCNVNRGTARVNNGGDRNPPNPDSGVVVTQEGNQLRSVVRIGMNSFTNTLTLENNGILTKVSNLKGRMSRCVFQKR